MRAMFAQLRRFAPGESTVVLEGERGTGKGRLAWEIHRQSARAEGPFVVVRCRRDFGSAFEVEVFGDDRDPHARRRGAFERAHGGTLFLDELEELPMALQHRLLRPVGARVVQRLGASDWQPVDVRIVASTAEPLLRKCYAGELLPALYYRLGGVRVMVPPLRERLEDLPDLIDEVFEQYGARGARLTREAMALLAARPWNGNLCELRAVLHRALLGLDEGVLRLV